MRAVLDLRRRNGWEAADSGILLWRDNLPWVFLFFIPPLLAAALMFCCIPLRMPLWAAILILWWLKPLFDRPLLHMLGVRFFEQDAPLRRLLKGLGKSLGRGLAGDLLWRRLSPRRSALMPVRLMEKLRPGEIARRRRVLQRGSLNFGCFLTLLGLGLEGMLLGGELLFFHMLSLFPMGPAAWFLNQWDTDRLLFFAYGINYLFTESLYVSMGFGLYINSRVEVEGWDIQLLFRAFLNRKSGRNPGRKPRPAPGAALLLALFLLPGLVRAENAAPEQALREILASPDFGGERDGWGIRFKGGEEKEAAGPVRPSWTEESHEGAARILRAALVLAAAAVILLSIARLWKLRRETPPKTFRQFGPGPSPEKNPGERLRQARFLFARGNIREAWAACLEVFIGACERGGLVSPPEATEYECLDLVRSWSASRGPEKGERVFRDFSLLVSRWVALAYGGILPREGAFEETVNCCSSLLRLPAEDDA
jgi:hypothetical protein